MVHFPAYFSSDLNPYYRSSMPRASRYLGHNRGHKYPEHYRKILDALELSGVVWTPYEDHRRYGYPISEVCWFSGFIMAHKKKIVCQYLAERVQGQFGRVQVIPEHPNHVVPVSSLDEIRSRFFDFAVHAVPQENRGRVARDPWQFVRGYMLWFERYSHPRILPFVEGAEEPTPRPPNEEVLVAAQHDIAGTSDVFELAQQCVELGQRAVVDQYTAEQHCATWGKVIPKLMSIIRSRPRGGD